MHLYITESGFSTLNAAVFFGNNIIFTRLCNQSRFHRRDICDMVHAYGGQVYLDGANMNAQVFVGYMLYVFTGL